MGEDAEVFIKMAGIKKSQKPIHGSGDYAREMNRVQRERLHELHLRKVKRSTIKAKGNTGRPHTTRKR